MKHNRKNNENRKTAIVNKDEENFLAPEVTSRVDICTQCTARVTLLGQSFWQRQLNQIDVSPTALTWNHEGTNTSPKRENDNNTKEETQGWRKETSGTNSTQKKCDPQNGTNQHTQRQNWNTTER
jgi:hypothetical protein